MWCPCLPVPLEAAPRVLAQVALQVATGERRRVAVDLFDGEASEEAMEQPLLRIVGRRAAGQRGPHELRREPYDGPQHGPGTAQADQEREHAPGVGQRAVEVERGDRRAPAKRSVLPARGQSSASATAARTSCESSCAGERLAAPDDVAPAPRLPDGGVLLGQPPLLERTHPVGAQAHLGECGELVGQRHGLDPAPGPERRRG